MVSLRRDVRVVDVRVTLRMMAVCPDAEAEHIESDGQRCQQQGTAEMGAFTHQVKSKDATKIGRGEAAKRYIVCFLVKVLSFECSKSAS